MGKNESGKYLKYAIGEIILVVIGILIALSINNWNESRKENTTAKILAKSLIEDLNQDVDILTDVVGFSTQKIKDCDELLSLLKTPVEGWDNAIFYEKINIIGQSNPFFPTIGTYEQIVTTGSLKYFDQSISNKLNAYNTNINEIQYWTDAEDKTLWLMAEILWKGINIQALSEIRFKQEMKNSRFIKIKESSIDEFSNYVAAVKTYRSKTLVEYEEQLQLAQDIIASLKAAYELY